MEERGLRSATSAAGQCGPIRVEVRMTLDRGWVSTALVEARKETGNVFRLGQARDALPPNLGIVRLRQFRVEKPALPAVVSCIAASTHRSSVEDG